MFIKLLLCSILLCFCLHKVQSYNAAVVEFKYGLPEENSLSPTELVKKHTGEYAKIVQNIIDLHEVVDIIVFPECTLAGGLLPKNADEISTYVPTQEEKVSPCEKGNNDDTNYSDFLIELSCLAKEKQIYLVVNIDEKENCNDTECPNGLHIYNTNVVFDRSGVVVARYRKFNLFGEKGRSKPDTPDFTTFTTDFGTTFGIFTCFDILFDVPSLELVRQGITDFIFPTMWFSELPFLTGVQTQEMWSFGNNVTLLASGAVRSRSSSGGSGIYTRGFQMTNIVEMKTHTHLFHMVRRNNDEVVNSIMQNLAFHNDANDNNAKKMDTFHLLKEDLSDYKFVKPDFDKSNTKYSKEVCDGPENDRLCCKVNIEYELNNNVDDTEKSRYQYLFVIKSGIRSFSGVSNGGMENCGLVACLKDDLDSCGKRFENYDDIDWPITFKNLEVTSTFTDSKAKKHFPNSLLADITPISRSDCQWNSKTLKHGQVERSFKCEGPIKKLLTFGIVGRNFDNDSVA